MPIDLYSGRVGSNAMFFCFLSYPQVNMRSSNLFVLLFLGGARQPPTHSGPLHKYSYSSCCSGSQQQSSKQLSFTPINLRQSMQCLHNIPGRHEASRHEHRGGHIAISSRISTMYSSDTPCTVKTKESSVHSTLVTYIGSVFARVRRSSCQDSIF